MEIADVAARLAAYQPRRLQANGTIPAAVLVLLEPAVEGPAVVLTVRTDEVEHHKGQVSFPGGARDPEDPDPWHTALRETSEEIGVDPRDPRQLGQLDEIVTTSEFLVTPYVAALARSPYPYRPNPSEVAEVLRVPLAWLLDPRNTVWEERDYHGRRLAMPAYWWRGTRIWGATGRMLHDFLEILRSGAAA